MATATPEKTGPSLAMRALAIVVLAVAAWILLKIVLNVIAGLATVVVVVAAIIGVIWAIRTL